MVLAAVPQDPQIVAVEPEIDLAERDRAKRLAVDDRAQATNQFCQPDRTHVP